jgi:hypothetical protein
MFEYKSSKSVKTPLGHLYPPTGGDDCTQPRSKDIPADRVTTAWLAEICNGKKWYREVHISFM